MLYTHKNEFEIFQFVYENLGKRVTSVHPMDDVLNSRPSIVHSLFYGENHYRVSCNACQDVCFYCAFHHYLSITI